MKSFDETGKQYGNWTVLYKDAQRSEKNTYWICQCNCKDKTIKSVMGYSLRKGLSTSCGCIKKQKAAQHMKQYNDINRENIIGHKYGLLTVLEITEKRNSQGQVIYKCQCECGNLHYVTSGNLKNGNVQSCGCSNSIISSKIKKILQENNVNFKTEYTFPDLLSPNSKVRLRFDFAIFDQNNNLSHLIEYDGEQHFRYTQNGWNNKNNYNRTIRNDMLKNEYCIKNNIKLLRISYLEKDTITIKKLLMEDIE